MGLSNFLFTSESVTEGHPDKVADQISDAILDAILEKDPYARVACETMVNTGMILIAGEITTEARVDYATIARGVVKEIGYNHSDLGFDWQTCAVLTSIDRQSPDIAMGVDRGEEIGAGDQGLMFGYACDETPDYMPMPIWYAHRLAMRLAEVRKKGILPFLRPDGKTQVTVAYEDKRPIYVHTVVIAAQHEPWVEYKELREAIVEEVIKKVIAPEHLRPETRFLVNTTGRFVIGGPLADCGMTGRKIIVDTYGGRGHHGGGAFSGKDPTKVDRTPSYYARYVAKNMVAAGVARELEVQVAYSIGVPEPIAINVQTFGTNAIPVERIVEIIKELFDFRPRAMIEYLDMRRPIFRKTACYGHFGRNDPDFTWERLDMVEKIRDLAGLD
ncbi:methionine adenosyltransferase [Thermosulfurimonas sp. F29]|uniref:methionine adenosyltransferase n=1 Tax=Thermosulfurimonas sp. F29 TaxID=2867247 RepID=UPI001C83B9D2|nr:methionine adenosyltransferase [Thermosulfurimonas sp. F29]MBX6423219.1 methionine adenosyltransferase [Thermosulfurimonas sp. F29]